MFNLPPARDIIPTGQWKNRDLRKHTDTHTHIQADIQSTERTEHENFDRAVITDNCERELVQQHC